MKRNNPLFKIILIGVSFLAASLCSPAFSQSLDEIIDSQPNTDQTITQPLETEDLVVTPSIEPQPADNVAAMRTRIIELAESKVGKVQNKAGEDGFKIGWQHLKEFYEVAYKLNDLEKERSWWMKDIKGVGKKINEWCGIFGVWAWRTSGLPVYWNTHVTGCKYIYKKNLIGPGDIAIIKKEVNPYNHHCVIKSVNGDSLVTIDGNQGMNSIQIKTRKLSDIELFYSVADAMGATPQKPAGTTPASAKPAPVVTKPTKPSGQTTTTKPTATGNSTGQATTPTPSSGNAQPSQKEIDELIQQVFNLIRITLGQFF